MENGILEVILVLEIVFNSESRGIFDDEFDFNPYSKSKRILSRI